jgi:hypothetical protein
MSNSSGRSNLRSADRSTVFTSTLQGTSCEASDRPRRADDHPFRRGPPLAPVGPRFLGTSPATAGRKDRGTVFFGSHWSRFRRCFAADVERVGYEGGNVRIRPAVISTDPSAVIAGLDLPGFSPGTWWGGEPPRRSPRRRPHRSCCA